MRLRKFQNNKDYNLIFKFSDIKLDLCVNPDIYDNNEFNIIKQIITGASDIILIDKTYVQYNNTKYEKTFITEDGWIMLCKLINQQKLNKKQDKKIQQIINESYKQIIIQYLYQFLDDLCYDISNIDISNVRNGFSSEICDNIIKQDLYPGKWQTWKCNQ